MFDLALIPLIIIVLMAVFAFSMVVLVVYLDGRTARENSKQEWVVTFIAMAKDSKPVKKHQKIKEEESLVRQKAQNFAELCRKEIMSFGPVEPQFIVRLEPKYKFDIRQNSRMMR